MIKYCNQNQLKEEVCLFMVAFPECESVRAGKAQPAGRSRKLGGHILLAHRNQTEREQEVGSVYKLSKHTPMTYFL